MIINNDSRVKVFLFAMALFVIVLTYLIKVLSDNFLYKYLEYIKSKFCTKFIVGLHWTISIIIAFTLPEYIVKLSFFTSIFEENRIWIYLATLISFFIALIILSAIFYLIFSLNRAKNNKRK